MRPVLGIELGHSRCVLVLVEDRRGAGDGVRVLAHHVVQYEHSGSLITDLRRLRLAEQLPRRARVVLWPQPGDPGVLAVDAPTASDGFSPDVWQLRDRLRPLVRAGFRVSAALAPSQAVAALAQLGNPSAVVAALAVGAHAGSMALVSRGTLVAAREMLWKFHAPGLDAPLVDRYVFASQLMPPLTRFMADGQRQRGARVERIVLCGSAPALRALAAPLIEEIDVEVETLDGPGGAVFEGEDPDTVASAQLAAGAAVAGPDIGVLPGLDARPALTPLKVVVGVLAAALAIVLVLLFWPAPQVSGRAGRPAAGTSVKAQ